VAPEDYVPKTLKTELRRRSRLLVTECLEIACSLTRALGVLHARGLVHRDIKPANIIFVGGVPKIADIGLVAASGQSSFVGTEGFVPPEGPGSVQADLFSLGKVLYEMTMGKDRLDFPALHSDLSALPDRELLLEVNALLLRACASDPRERYTSAEEMLADIDRLRGGRGVACRSPRWAPLASIAALILLTVGAGAWWHRERQPGTLTVQSEPPGAMVLLHETGTMHRSPATFTKVTSGQHTLRVMLPGYEPQEIPFEMEPHRELKLAPIRLQRSHGELAISCQPAHAEYALLQGRKVVSQGPCPAHLPSLETGEYTVRITHAGSIHEQPVEITRGETAKVAAEFLFHTVSITSEPPGAQVEVDRQPAGTSPLEISLPRGSHEVTARFGSWPAQTRTVEITSGEPAAVSFAFPRGSVKVSSAPAGATVWSGERELGRAPLLVEDLEPGRVSYELRHPGYKPATLTGEVKPGEQLFLGGRLTQRPGPRRGEPWENSLGMQFAPVGVVLCGRWPVRVRDYDAFCAATQRVRLQPDFPQDPTHPVVRVNLEDATAFAEWLTAKESREGTLESGQLYRLPTDAEWSEAAGLPTESGATPEQRDGKLPDFPWGRPWPPPAGAGNYADVTLRASTLRIPGYRDGFAQTSPVGSFAANALGLQDMGGNVWQWVADSYKGDPGKKDWGVLRGGSWGTSARAELRSAYRNVVDRSERDVIIGFRVVLVPEP
jgi:hypothetical protein